MTTFDAIKVVAGRELRVKLRDRTLLISTIIFLIFAGASTILPALLNDDDPSTVAVADRSTAAKLTDAGLEVRVVESDQAAEALVREGDVDAAVVGGPKVLAMEDAPGDVVRALSNVPPVQLLDPEALNPLVAYMVPVALAMVFFFTSITFGMQIAQSVTEEKQTRIVEILVASVPVRALLAGKVIAIGILAFGQITLIAAVAMAGMRFSDTTSALLEILSPAIGWFIPFFVVGFLMLAAVWAAVGALVNRQEDLGGASMPAQLAIMLPFFGVVFFNDNPGVMKVLSYVPLSSPIAMPVRFFSGDAAGWEPIVSLLLLAVTAAAVVALGARIYEGSLLRTNGRTSLVTAWRNRETVAP
jgi:ABC-2 type transport system permease protein